MNAEEDVVITISHSGLVKRTPVSGYRRQGRGGRGVTGGGARGDAFQKTLFIAVKSFDNKHFVLMVSREGMIKKVLLSEFSNPRRGGITAANMKGNDAMTDVKL